MRFSAYFTSVPRVLLTDSQVIVLRRAVWKSVATAEEGDVHGSKAYRVQPFMLCEHLEVNQSEEFTTAVLRFEIRALDYIMFRSFTDVLLILSDFSCLDCCNHCTSELEMDGLRQVELNDYRLCLPAKPHLLSQTSSR